MDRPQAIELIDLIGLASSSVLCFHVPGASCDDCAVSVVMRLWEAIDVLRATDWPAVETSHEAPHGASVSS